MINQNSIISICDLDTLIYLVSYQHKDNNDVDLVINDVDTYMNLIMTTTNCSHYLGFIGGERCFRYDFYPEYKSNRPESPDWFIKWKSVIRYRLVDYWGVLVSDGRESEDDCIICANHYKQFTNVVLVHVDKDLSFWEGNHWDYQKHRFYYVDKLGYLELNKSKIKGVGLKWFYTQLICGDASDNIKGLKGKGPAFAYKLLNDCTTEYSLFRRTYLAFLKYSNREHFILTWKLIKMLDKLDGWEIPTPVKYIKKEFNLDDLV